MSDDKPKLPSRFDDEPDFVNEKGVRWWLQDDFTDQANPELKGTCWAVELPSGERELVFMAPNGAILKSTTKPPTMHDWIYVQKLADSEK